MTEQEKFTALVRDLCKLPSEAEWVEFKVNTTDPDKIGETISALANATALINKDKAYMLWGIEDETHKIVGTKFSPAKKKKGNDLLEPWLLRKLRPQVYLRFDEGSIDGQRIVVLEIEPARSQPVRFNGDGFIRVSSSNRKLKGFPEKERKLWGAISRMDFENGIADDRLSGENVLLKLDYPAYFELLGLPLPDGRRAILDSLQQNRLIVSDGPDNFNITNLGAILFAKNLDDFPSLKRKAVRVIQYSGRNRIQTIREQEGKKGYACGFKGLVAYINGLLPENEIIKDAQRESDPMFPELAVRELVANALIHQDFFVTGAGPMIEIFDDRIEITNPGEPLVDTQRFLDRPPQSRNEALALLMRHFGLCEERGSGIDKVVSVVELYQLPAPLFEVPQGSTRATLFAHKAVSKMDAKERIRSCYLHACLKRVSYEYLTNASLRKRFGVKKQNASAVSRYIREAVEAGKIEPYDPNAAKKSMKYVPFWASDR